MNFVPGRAAADGVLAVDGARIAGKVPARRWPQAPRRCLRCGPSASGCSRQLRPPTAHRHGRGDGLSRARPAAACPHALSAKPFLVRVTADAADRRPVCVGRRRRDSAGTPPTSEFSQTDRRRSLMAQKTIAFFPKPPLARRSIRSASPRPSRSSATRRCSCPIPASSMSTRAMASRRIRSTCRSRCRPSRWPSSGWTSSTATSRISARSPYDQIDNYVKDCWAAIVDSAKWAQKDLPRRARPRSSRTSICVDNVILFPAIKRYRQARGCASSPARRTRSRIADIPPHLSGCGENDHAGLPALPRSFQRGDQADP